jgi:hypothetical protein
VAIVVLTWFVTTVRYAGIALVPVVALGVWLASERRPFGRRLTLVLGTTLVSLVPLALVVWHNLALGAGPLGDRRPSAIGPKRLFDEFVQAGQELTVGPDVRAGTFIGLTVMALVAVAALMAIRSRRPDLLVLATYLVLAIGMLAYSALTTTLDPINVRLLHTVAIPALVLVVWALRQGLLAWSGRAEGATARGVRWRRGAAVALLAVAVAGAWSAARTYGVTATAQRDGIGYNAVKETTSQLNAALQELPADARIASSRWSRTSWALDLRAVGSIPPRTSRYSGSIDASTAARVWIDRAQGGAVDYFVFYRTDRPAVDVDALRRGGVELTEVGRFPEGDVYRVGR